MELSAFAGQTWLKADFFLDKSDAAPPIPSIERKYVCYDCGQVFSSSLSWHRHRKAAHLAAKQSQWYAEENGTCQTNMMCLHERRRSIQHLIFSTPNCLALYLYFVKPFDDLQIADLNKQEKLKIKNVDALPNFLPSGWLVPRFRWHLPDLLRRRSGMAGPHTLTSQTQKLLHTEASSAESPCCCVTLLWITTRRRPPTSSRKTCSSSDAAGACGVFGYCN